MRRKKKYLERGRQRGVGSLWRWVGGFLFSLWLFLIPAVEKRSFPPPAGLPLAAPPAAEGAWPRSKHKRGRQQCPPAPPATEGPRRAPASTVWERAGKCPSQRLLASRDAAPRPAPATASHAEEAGFGHASSQGKATVAVASRPASLSLKRARRKPEFAPLRPPFPPPSSPGILRPPREAAAPAPLPRRGGKAAAAWVRRKMARKAGAAELWPQTGRAGAGLAAGPRPPAAAA